MMFFLTFFITALVSQTDVDRDGIDDQLEQHLLLKFRPAFLLDIDECDGQPAEFRSGVKDPQVTEKNGTIYGQVFKTGQYTEIHYYHLWTRDCGRNSHAFDVEHVSVLLSPEYTARFWYAAAHENTVCNASNGARASDLGAEDQGATVWVSRGKHASYLSLGNCRLGCGVDRCKGMTALTAANLINIGEPGAPMNGALWIQSEKWPVAEKMRSDFPESVITLLENPEAPVVIVLNPPTPPTKAVILSGDSALDGALAGNRHGGKAGLTGLTYGGKAVLRAGKAVGRIFGIK